MIHFFAVLFHRIFQARRAPQRKYAVRQFIPQGERLQSREMLAADFFDPASILQTEHEEPFVQMRLETVDLDGSLISAVSLDEEFLLQVFVQDVRAEPEGIFSAYLDVSYDQNLLSVVGPINYGPGFDFAQSGDTSTAGLIDEVGATVFSIGTGGDDLLLFSIRMRADAGGSLTLSSDPADILPIHEVTIFGGPIVVPNEKISFGTSIFEVLETTARDDVFVVGQNSTDNALDVLANDMAGTIDGSLAIVEVSPTDQGGQIVVEQGATLRYTPANDFTGVETFSYRVMDEQGNISPEAIVTVTVGQSFDSWQNPDNRFDVDGNTLVNSLDLLKTIRDLNAQGNRLLTLPPPPGEILFVDVNGDTISNPLDIVLLITEINRIAAEGESVEEGEGESAIGETFASAEIMAGMSFSPAHSPALLGQTSFSAELLDSPMKKSPGQEVLYVGDFAEQELLLVESSILEKSVDSLFYSWQQGFLELLDSPLTIDSSSF